MNEQSLERDLNEVADMYAVATDYESSVLYDVQLRAGIIRECPTCQYAVHRSETHCQDCGSDVPPLISSTKGEQ